MNNEKDTSPQDELLARYLAGEPDAAAQAEAWIAASGENRAYFETLKRAWDVSGKAASTRFDTDAAWKKMQTRMQPEKISRRRYAAAAAVVFLLISVSVAYLLTRPAENAMQQLAVTSGGKPIQDTLPDGSIVNVNRDSRIEFLSVFTGETREVTLSGEAFFDVKRDPSKPFIIHAGGMDVRVLGTSFNVRAYPGTDSVHVFVNTGRVKCQAGTDSIVVGPGESVVYNRRANTLRKTTETDPNTLSWRTRTFEFNGTPLSVAVKKLNDVYGSSIVVKNRQLDQCRLTATFRNESVDNIVAVIGDALGLTIDRKGQTILLDGKGCQDN